jgi:hypothetical protein
MTYPMSHSPRRSLLAVALTLAGAAAPLSAQRTEVMTRRASGDDDASHTSTAPAAPAAAADGDGSDGGSSDTLAIVALIVGALGVLTGVAALATRRRSSPAA